MYCGLRGPLYGIPLKELKLYIAEVFVPAFS